MNIKPLRRPGGALLPLVTASLIALAGTLTAAPRFVMEIRNHEGDLTILGESDATGHEGAIEVVSFGKGYTPASGGFPSVDTTGIECGIVVDKALPKLIEALVQGNTLHQVDIFYLGNDSLPSNTRAAHMRLEHVQITELTTGVGTVNPLGPAFADGPHVAHMTLNFSEVTWTYQTLDPNGTATDESSSEHTAHEPTEDPNFDDDGDGLPNDQDDDDDNDDVPDDYETTNGTNALVDDGDADKDQDKKSNRDEWLAGTRADDPTSFFAIESLSIRQGPEGRTATISFPVVAERRYRLLGTLNPEFPKESWMEFDAFDTLPGSPDSITEVELSPGILPQLGNLLFTVEVSPLTSGPIPPQ